MWFDTDDAIDGDDNGCCIELKTTFLVPLLIDDGDRFVVALFTSDDNSTRNLFVIEALLLLLQFSLLPLLVRLPDRPAATEINDDPLLPKSNLFVVVLPLVVSSDGIFAFARFAFMAFAMCVCGLRFLCSADCRVDVFMIVQQCCKRLSITLSFDRTSSTLMTSWSILIASMSTVTRESLTADAVATATAAAVAGLRLDDVLPLADTVLPCRLCGGRGKRRRNHECFNAAAGVIRNSGSHSRQPHKKFMNNGSSQPFNAFFKLFEPGGPRSLPCRDDPDPRMIRPSSNVSAKQYRG